MNATSQQLDLSQKVHKCIQQAQWHPAKHHLQRLLKLDPHDAQAYQLLGLVHVQLAKLSTSADLKNEHVERALSAFLSATQLGPHMFDAHLNLGNIYLQTHRYPEAVSSFETALALEPNSDLAHAHLAEAYKLLQVIDKALASYGRALQLAPHKHAYLINAGNLLRESSRFTDAVACYEQAIQIEPEHAEAYAHMAIAMVGLDQVEAALGCCRIALDIDPTLSIAQYHKALIELRQEDRSAALDSLNAALELQPQSAHVWASKGLLLAQMHEPAAAIDALDRAIERGIPSADLYQNRAHCFKELKQLDSALDDLEKALALDPHHPNALMALGVMSQEMGRFEAALGLYARVIEQNPDKAEAYSNLGAVLFELNRFEDSLETLQAAIDLDPSLVTAWSNLGATLTKLYRYEQAVKAYQEVQRLDPTHVDAFSYQGLLLHDLKRLDEAMVCYEKALSLDPENSLASWHRAICLLLQGDFEQGWPAYEARWRHKNLKLHLREYSKPRWTGEQSLKGQHILVYFEQGLGDTLQFARFLPHLVDLGAHVTFEVQPALKQLLARCLPQIHIIGAGEPLPAFDLHVPLMSIPAALHHKESTFPLSAQYLSAAITKSAEWKRRLGAKSRLRIGLVWSGNPAHQNDRNRTIPLEEFLRALPEGFDYICLQNQIRTCDMEIIGHSDRVQVFATDLQDFEDTAALCQHMDLVVTVDTSVAHLSAALGRPTWTFIPHSSDWRWMMDRNNTPWYESMRLIRQTTPGSWQLELSNLASDLRAFAAHEDTPAKTSQEKSMAVPLAA